MTTPYQKKYGATRFIRGQKIMAMPDGVTWQHDKWKVKSQRIPNTWYVVYNTADGPRCGRGALYSKGCLDKFYRHAQFAKCKHEFAVTRRRSDRLRGRVPTNTPVVPPTAPPPPPPPPPRSVAHRAQQPRRSSRLANMRRRRSRRIQNRRGT